MDTIGNYQIRKRSRIGTRNILCLNIQSGRWEIYKNYNSCVFKETKKSAFEILECAKDESRNPLDITLYEMLG